MPPAELAQSPPATVLVVGSIHSDELLTVEHAPRAGETVVARDVTTAPGGKGANQAVAAVRWGAKVAMIGAVGDDPAGPTLRRCLEREGLDISLVVTRPAPSTRAVVVIDRGGENRIVVAPGASGLLTAEDLRRVTASRAAVVVTQAEVAPEVTVAAADLARQLGARFVLNLAPFRATPAEVLNVADPLVVNEHEARALVGLHGAAAVTPSQLLDKLGGAVRSAVVTVGADGAMVREGRGDPVSVPAPSVACVVDTTGAGDTLVGVLAAELATGSALPDAVRAAVTAATHSVTRLGAQSSMPQHHDRGDHP